MQNKTQRATNSPLENLLQNENNFGPNFIEQLCNNPRKIFAWLENEFKNKDSVASKLLPEIKAIQGCQQDRVYHAEGDVWTHTKLHFEKAKQLGFEITPELALALLYHDTGKPSKRVEDKNRVHFPNHEAESARLFHQAVERLKLNQLNIDCDDIERKIADHGVFYREWSSGKVDLADIRRHLPQGTHDLLFKLIACDINASYSDQPAITKKNQALLAEITTNAKQLEKLPGNEKEPVL